MLVPGIQPPRKQRTSSSPSLRFFLKGLSIFSFWGESWSLQGLPTYPFLSSSKHHICLSTTSFSFSFNSLLPSYSCLYFNISILNSITYSSQNLQYSFLLLDSLGPSAPRAHFQSMAKVPSHDFPASFHYGYPTASCPHSKCFLHSSSLFAERDSHLFSPFVCKSNTGWGLGYCRDKSSISCSIFERTSSIFSQFSHTQTLLHVPQQARLSSLWLPAPCHPKPGTHFVSLQYSVGAWDICKKMTAPEKLQKI